MVHQQLPRTNDVEHRLARFVGCSKAASRHRSPRLEPKFGHVQVCELLKSRQLHERVVTDHIDGLQLQLRTHARKGRFTNVGLHFETYGATEAPTSKLHFHRCEKVFCILIVEREVGIPSYSEARNADDLHSGKQPIQMRLNEILQQDEVMGVRYWNESWKVPRHFNPCKTLFARVGVANRHCEIERQIGDVRKGM